MKQLTKIGLLLLPILLISCATNETGQNQTYSDAVNSRPLPKTESEKAQECSWIRQEIARQQSIAQYGASIAVSPMYAVAYQAAARRNIAALESRASVVQCSASFSSVIQNNQSKPEASMSFDDCFAKCTSLTARSKEQCFDTCKK